MPRENRFKNIQERLDGMRARPRVALFVDVDSVCADPPQGTTVDDGDLSRSLLEVASLMGRVTRAAMYYEEGNLDPPIVAHAWTNKGFTIHSTPTDAVTEDGVNLPLLFDAYDEGAQRANDIYVLAVGATSYNALVKKIISHGASVVLISNYPRQRRTLPKESCIYIPLRSVILKPASPVEKRPSTVKAQEYDFKKFVLVLAESENRMPFVSAKYFVTRVMWRLKDLRTHEEKQAVFQEAADRGIVEFYEQDNIDGSDNKVSACRLNRGHELVVGAVEGAVEGTGKEDVDGDRTIVVTIDGGPSDSATFAAPPPEQTSTL